MINIAIDKPLKLPGLTAAFIGFDTFNESLIDRIRNMSDRVYHKETKQWEIPIDELESFISAARNFEMNITLNKVEAEKTNIPKKYVFKTKPYTFQKTGVEYALSHDSFLLGDEMGTGKTKQIIDTACCRKLLGQIKQCLVVVGVNSLKYNWLDEVHTHSNEKAWVLGTQFRKNGTMFDGGTKDKINDLKTHTKELFLITNIETFRSDKFVDALKKNKNIDMMVIDEAHYCRNSQSHQGKNILKVSNIPYKIAATGTPLVNSPVDAYAVLKWLGIEKSNFTTFKRFYCNYGGYGGYQIVGYKNLHVLRESLQNFMLRRLKRDVLDLPEKTIKNEYVDMLPGQSKIYNEFRNQILDNVDKIALSDNPLTELLRLRQCTDWSGILSTEIAESSKMDRLLQLVDDILESGNKVVISSNWTSVTDIIVEKLKHYKPVVITGQYDVPERHAAKDRFQTDENCRVCVGTIGAMGTGITLTAATYMIFYDLPWTRAAFDQCTDRLDRIGQRNDMTIIKLIARNTIDERIDEIILGKGAMSDMLVDGKIQGDRRSFILQMVS